MLSHGQEKGFGPLPLAPSFRRSAYRQFFPEAWPDAGLSPLNKFLVALILFSVTWSVAETEPTLYERWPLAFDYVDIALGAMFTVEYALRVWLAGEDARYKGIGGRARYVCSVGALIDLVALLPFLLTLGAGDAFLLRTFRLLRIISIARLGRFSRALSNIVTALKERGYELLMAIGAALLVMLVSATALYLTEGAQDPEHFGSIPRAMWWGVATITKVGYGGAFPETELGRVFAAIFAFAAVGVVALPTGIVAAALGSVFRRDQT